MLFQNPASEIHQRATVNNLRKLMAVTCTFLSSSPRLLGEDAMTLESVLGLNSTWKHNSGEHATDKLWSYGQLPFCIC